mgnify:FL=1
MKNYLVLVMLKKNENIDYKMALAEVIIKTFIKHEGENMIRFATDSTPLTQMILGIVQDDDDAEEMLNMLYQGFINQTEDAVEKLLDRMEEIMFTHKPFSDYRKAMDISDDYIKNEVNMEGLKIMSFNYLMGFANTVFFEKLENMGLDFDVEEAFGMRDTNEFDSDFSEGFA